MVSSEEHPLFASQYCVYLFIHSENRNYTAQVSPKRKTIFFSTFIDTYAINNAIDDVYFELYCINWILLYVYTCFQKKFTLYIIVFMDFHTQFD